MEYNASAISVDQNLARVRLSPHGYIGTKDIPGQVHMIREIVDNSVDEVILKPEGGDLWIFIMRDLVGGRYQIGIADGGRGIPAEAIVNVHTLLGASGKSREDTAYQSSGGQFGNGAKVAAALSSRMRVISKNYLDSVVSSLAFKDSEITEHYTDQTDPTFNVLGNPSGTVTVFEPDLPGFFINGQEFMTSGYLDLVNTCRQLNVFNPGLRFNIAIYDRLIPSKFWKAPINEALATIQNVLRAKDRKVVYDTRLIDDTISVLFDTTWKATTGRIFEDYLEKNPASPADRLGFKVRWYFTQRSPGGYPQFFIMVNNVHLVDKTNNSATVSFMNVVRKHLAAVQTKPEMAEFILTEYRFPTMLLAIGVQYHKAALSGATKSSFVDSIFASQFEADLEAMFEAKGGQAYWESLSKQLQSDIELRYGLMYSVQTSSSKGKKVFADLIFHDNYSEARNATRETGELFLVEGQSAGNIITSRDNNYQAIYQTKGKPLNSIVTVADQAANRQALMNNPLYQDIMKIIGVTPSTRDLSNARFNKIIIATDADPDGYHIRALHLNNLYILNKAIIESGMVWIANPPLYGMRISKNKKIFLRDKNALIGAKVDLIYRPAIGMKICLPTGTKELKDELFREACFIIEHVGEQFERLANQLNIPPLILERLVFGAEYLYPKLNYQGLLTMFNSADPTGTVRIKIDEFAKLLIISIGKEDRVVGLNSVGVMIKDHLLPLCHKFRVRDLMFEFCTLLPGGAFPQPQKASVVMMYEVLQTISKIFSVSRYKGLGQMDSSACAITIMRPETRSITQITDIGDPQMNMQLLGKSSSERKLLLSESGALNTSFRKANFSNAE